VLKLSDMTKKIIVAILVLLLLVIAGGVVFYRSFEALPFALGAILGAGLNIYKMIMLDRLVKVASLAPEANQKSRLMRRYYLQTLFRFVLTAGVLALAHFVPFLNFWGAVAGIFILPLAAFSMKFVSHEDGDDVSQVEVGQGDASEDDADEDDTSEDT